MERSSGAFWFYGMLGALFSGMAIVSLIQHLFAVGLAPTMATILETYRAMVHPVMDFLLEWVRWLLPQWKLPWWVKDLYALSFLGGAMITRSAFVFLVGSYDLQGIHVWRKFAGYLSVFLFSMVLGATGIGLIFALGMILGAIGIARTGKVIDYKQGSRNREFQNLWLFNFLTAVFGTILFFSINAFS